MIETNATAAAAAGPILEAAGLHTYYGTSHILRGVELAIHAGESVALLGRNGMGKTTTIRTILGLTPPSGGLVRIEGRVVTGAPAHEVARLGVALVPEGRGIFPNLTVKENLTMAARPDTNNPNAWTLARILETFPALAERMDIWGDLLSGGEQQMLSIGRALMTNPRLLILDEATEGMAPRLRRQIWSVIETVKADGVATLIVDKDLDAMLRVCDRCLILAKGSVVFSGSASELAAKPDIHVRYLGV
jgi:branched-chain amino acid transport system ATP-binding protein